MESDRPSGLKCSESSKNVNPSTLSGKTSRVPSTRADLPKSCEDSAELAICLMWRSYRLRKSVRRILGNEFLWLPTPMSYSGKHRLGQTKLDLKLRLLPTPTASQGGDFPKKLKAYLPTGQVLNLQFVEWIMGFPIDWTDLRC